MWLKLLRNGIKISGINKSLSSWRKSPFSLSSNTKQKIFDAFKLYYFYEKFNLFFSIYLTLRLSIFYFVKDFNKKKIYEFNKSQSFIWYNFHFFFKPSFKKLMFFNDNLSFSKHKKLAVDNKNTLLTGGLSFLVLLFLFFEGNYFLKLFCCLVFIIGIISDLNLINSPAKRLFLQAIIISFFIFYFENNIYFTDIYYLDLILEYNIISYLFTIYCFLILINGTNFIDGLNGLVR